ncbi:MAG: HupE/UreJ family protein [Jatrophihabitantaceae bacterium]|nr:HupE/UreJ family protein [Jatrophihabitantaceae bacterium]
MPNVAPPRARAIVLAVAIAVAVLTSAWPAGAHGFSSTVYVDVTSPGRQHVQAELGLEYDLLVVSAADYADDDALFREGTAAFEGDDADRQAAVLKSHSAAVGNYVTERLSISADGRPCDPTPADGVRMEQREGVPYAVLVLDFECQVSTDVHEIRSELFPNSETYVRDTKTIVTYELDLRSGSTVLDAEHPSFSTDQTLAQWFWEFFRLGAEHLLTGLDHILFLLALIAGSRRLREVVLAAATFTLAHSVTFVLAALGLVYVSASVVEPIIALSIAVVAGWYLWRLYRRGAHADDLDGASDSHLSLDRAGWARLAVVFCFGLVHGLGFAGALGIDEAFSWRLLSSLLVFNVGIETVQLTIIAAIFPVLAVLRRRSPATGLWVTGSIAASVTTMGLIWFVQRLMGL